MRGAVAALGLVLAGWPLAAVAQTAITPDTAPGRGLGTTVGQSGRVFTIDGGTRAGANLFHSFAGFDLGAGDTASWSRAAGDGAEIGNVVNRVTGGSASHISGVIDSTALPNASFYFVNPAGIVFGAGAQVNVPSAAYFSTAAEVRFADGATFATATPGGSTLSMAAPESFGFVGGQGAIALDGLKTTFAPTAATLSFSASDVTVTGSQVAARGLDVIAVGDQTTAVRLADPLSAARGGQVSLDHSILAVVTTDGPGAPARLAAGEVALASSSIVSDSGGSGRGGDVLLQGDHVALAPDAFVITSARGAGAGGQLRVDAGTIEVDARGATTTTGFSSGASAAGAAGAITLTADTIRLLGETDNDFGNAVVGSTVVGAGGAGDVTLTADHLVIDIGVISSYSIGAGDGGDIRIKAANQELGAATVLTGAFGDGQPGDVRIDGETITISGGMFGATPGSTQASGGLVIAATKSLEAEGGSFSANSANANSSGRVTLSAPYLLLSQSRLDTQAYDEGLAGQILVEAQTLLLDRVMLTSDSRNGAQDTGLVRLKATGDLTIYQGQYSASVLGTAKGGRIEIEGRNVLLDGALIATETLGFGSGAAGQIAITAANRLTVTTATDVSSNTASEGRGGDIVVKARAISVDAGSAIHSDTFFSSDAGSVTLSASETLDLMDGASITSEAVDGTGNAGSVTIDAGRITMNVATISSSTGSLGDGGSVIIRAGELTLDGGHQVGTSITSETLLGAGGDVTIDARKLTLTGEAAISSSSFGDGHAGNVSIVAGELSVLDSGFLNSAGFFAGDAGNISIVADRVLIQGSLEKQTVVSSAGVSGGKAGDVSLKVGSLILDSGVISSDTFGGGDAGDVRVDAGSVVMKNFSGISSSTNSVGNAGSVVIEADTLAIESRSLVLSAATSFADGDAGEIRIVADKVTVGKDASVTTATFGRGDAGAVIITAKSLLVDGGEVSSSSGVGAAGAASTVDITADDLTVVNAGIISTVSANPNKAGAITIAAGQLTVDGLRSVISSENTADDSGDAGSVSITAANVRIANGGGISTDSDAGAAGNIDIRVPRPGLVILEGDEFPGLILTSSGPGTGGIITIADPLAVITDGAAILALGEQGGANVRIQSRYFIQSTDHRNRIDVAGEIKLDTGIYDVSSGTVSRDLSVLDASKVLRGQCPAARSTGAVSQLITRPVGPYAREPLTLGPSTAPAIAATTGACP